MASSHSVTARMPHRTMRLAHAVAAACANLPDGPSSDATHSTAYASFLFVPITESSWPSQTWRSAPAGFQRNVLRHELQMAGALSVTDGSEVCEFQSSRFLGYTNAYCRGRPSVRRPVYNRSSAGHRHRKTFRR